MIRLSQISCLLLLTASLGCHAQTGATSDTLSPDLARRVEILIRTRSHLPPDVLMNIGGRSHSDIPGYDQIAVTFTQDGRASKPAFFLISKDGKTLAQFSKFDISQDPRALVSPDGRPGRGGGADAPVQIVAFDDLECPYCTRMHSQLFPALLDRYGNKVRIVYRDFPLNIHPWAMRAAVDVNCVAAQSPSGYWNLVDYIHAHSSEIGKEKNLQMANDRLDELTLDEAKKDHLKVEEVQGCVKKQDESGVRASMKMGDALDIQATPVLFINGEKLEGAYPLVDVFRMVDGALLASGQTPPPPYVPPADRAPASAAPAVAPGK